VIKMFLENFSALALHKNHYGKTDLLELRIELEAGTVPKRSKVRPLNPDQRANLKEQLDEWIEQGVIEPANSPWASSLVPVKKKDWKITLADKFKEDQGEVTREWRKFAGYPPAVQSMSPEIQRKIIKGNRIRKLQEVDPIWQEVIKWVIEVQVPKLPEVRGKGQEVFTVRQLFNTVKKKFVLNYDVLFYNRHTDSAKTYDAQCICNAESKFHEVFQICHEGLAAGHRGANGTLGKFQRTFFTLSSKDKIRRPVECCDVCLTKERSIKYQMGPRMQSPLGNVEAGTVARAIVREHFSVYGLPKQIHSMPMAVVIIAVCWWIRSGSNNRRI